MNVIRDSLNKIIQQEVAKSNNRRVMNADLKAGLIAGSVIIGILGALPWIILYAHWVLG